MNIVKLIKYFYVSIIGLSLDICFYSLFVYLFETSVFYSNIVSSLISITFVYIASANKIFNKKGSINSYVAYIVYQIASINFYSFAISYLNTHLLFNAIISKGITVPFSFMTNYLFMYLLSKYFLKELK